MCYVPVWLYLTAFHAVIFESSVEKVITLLVVGINIELDIFTYFVLLNAHSRRDISAVLDHIMQSNTVEHFNDLQASCQLTLEQHSLLGNAKYIHFDVGVIFYQPTIFIQDELERYSEQ